MTKGKIVNYHILYAYKPDDLDGKVIDMINETEENEFEEWEPWGGLCVVNDGKKVIYCQAMIGREKPEEAAAG